MRGSLIDGIIDNQINDSPPNPMSNALRESSLSGPIPSEAGVMQVVMALEEDIVFGTLHPRERLVEDELMSRFGAKRHVVRQALADLERIGLVSRPPNRSAVVRDLTPLEVEHIYAMRELLETAAAAQMPLPMNADALERLKTIQNQHDDATAVGDIRAVFRINIEFHRALFGQCGNPHLSATIETFGKKAHAVRSFSTTRVEHIEGARRDHWALIDALQACDRSRLVALCRAHIQVSKRAYIEAYHRRFPEVGPAVGMAIPIHPGKKSH